jgi:DNA-binding LacI/PurR family transcriptional regulator
MATIKDVAKHANVSIATVSRIINNRGAISNKTRQIVYDSMKALNYQPNEMARALQKQKSNMIGLIVPSIEYAFFSRLIEAIEETCHNNGYKLILCRSGENEDREIEMVSMLEGNKVDGIILCSRLGDAGIYAGKTLPIVSIDRTIEGFSTVTSDNYYGGVLAAKELYRAGSKYPVLFGNKIPEYMAMNERNIGFIEECKKLGMELQYIGAPDTFSDETAIIDSFVRGMEKLRQADGLFITGDALAAKIVCNREIRKKGIISQIPIVSYDGMEISELLDITTIAQPIYEMGVCATEQVIRGIEGKVMHTRSVLPVQIVKRRSTSIHEKCFDNCKLPNVQQIT